MIWHKYLYVLCLGWLMAALIPAAYPAARNGRPAETENAQTAARRQLRADAQKSHKDIEALLTELLQLVQVNERPSSNLIEKCRAALEANKQNALAYEDSQRADYMLLQAWTGFFQDNMAEALNWSMRACKQYEADQDGWISQAFFNMLSGKRPIEPKIEKAKPEAEQRLRAAYRPRQNVEVAPEAPKLEPYSEKGILEFDFFSLRPEFVREQFERIQCMTTSGQAVAYTPQTDYLCIFFYQSKDKQQEQSQETGSEVFEGGQQAAETEMAHVPALDLDAQHLYFSELMKACKGMDNVKFWQVDTVRPKDLGSMDTAGVAESGIPTIVASDPQSNGRRLACDAHNPFMMIVDKTGTVRYSGPAGYFMPAFILTELTDKEIILRPTGSSEAVSYEAMWQQGDPNRPMTDPNHPLIEPNALPPVTQMTAPARTETNETVYGFETDETEQQISAENLLRLAQMEIEESIKIRGSNPKEGVDACRQVLKKYPDTPYAKQAQELLRRLPQRYKERFNITDEELGL